MSKHSAPKRTATIDQELPEELTESLTVKTMREDRPPLTVPEAAEELRVTPTTLRRWIAQGLLVTVKPGARYLVPASEVDRLLAPR